MMRLIKEKINRTSRIIIREEMNRVLRKTMSKTVRKLIQLELPQK